jgi:hypothetical protein
MSTKKLIKLALGLLALPILLVGQQLVQAATSELFFSEYIEGSSNNKALEIYNGTESPVDLAAGDYDIQMFFNGSASAGLTIALTGTVAAGDVYVVAQSSATTTILAQADQTNGAGWFNGDDAIVLRKNDVVIDSIGQVGVDPGAEWGSGNTSTQDNTLRRKTEVCAGDTDASNAFDPSIEWDGFPTDTFDGLGAHTADCETTGENAPTVASTTPTDGATDVATDANITINFSEDVAVSGSWFDLTCTSGSHTATASGGPQSFTLDPDADFASADNCTVSIFAGGVTDLDADDPPDNMEADYIFSFSVVELAACSDPATLIHDIQGSGASSPSIGSLVTVEGVVVGDYQNTTTQLSGFFIQEEDGQADADAATSEGVFIFDNGLGVDVATGDVVRVKGQVAEFNNLTELGSVSQVQLCSSGASVTPTSVSLPVVNLSDLERYEGMLVTFPQELTVTENFSLGRFGSVDLSVNGRLFNPTHLTTPGAAANAQQDLNNRSRIILDDANNQQNIDPTFYPTGGLSALNTLRSGYTLTGLIGVLEERFGSYRIQPIGPVNFAADNPRPASPGGVGGRLKVASLNVLNYFTTIDTGPDICGPAGNLDCRGADSAQEFTRQRDKIINTLLTINPDIAGLIELENNPSASIQDLVDGLNAIAGAGTYSFINTGTIGTDAIKVGLIYKPATVTPVGSFAILTSAIDPLFNDTKNRPALAQSFSENGTGEVFTVAINHLKSKGSDCNDVSDPDTGDGQGNCNITRTNAATALVNWLGTDPTGSGDLDVLIIGDLNAYAMEDPITAITDAGYTNLVDTFLGQEAYSFVFQGQSGYLDHALANGSLTSQVTGVTEWHMNADEPIVLDYNVEFKSANHVTTLYDPGPFRAADHDPVIVGLELLTPVAGPQCNGVAATIYVNEEGKIVGGPNDGRTYRGILRGTDENDVMVGTDDNDLITGFDGNDLICGLGNEDLLRGVGGDDSLSGGDDKDLLDGGSGNDSCDGGSEIDLAVRCETKQNIP